MAAERQLLRVRRGGGPAARSLALTARGLRRLPRSLGAMKALEGLNLRDNNLRRLPQEVEALGQLKVLNLGNNEFEEVPEQLKCLISLQKLHLFGNKITRISPLIFDGLQNLVLLNLNNNQLNHLPPEIHRLENLECVSLNNNKLKNIPKEFCYLRKLRELHLSHNSILGLPEEIKYLTRLKILILSRNKIEELPDGLSKLKRLKVLDVAGNNIRIFPIAMEDLELEELYCEDNPLLERNPVSAVQEEDILTLKELTARFIFHQLENKKMYLFRALKKNPQAQRVLSSKRKCAQCGCSFLSMWLECVQFVDVKQSHIERSPNKGLAFAALSSVHPVFGLYGSLFPVIIYAIFGMGRHVATGTFALTSLISANAVERLVPPRNSSFTANNTSAFMGLSEFEMQRIGVAAAVSFLGGLIQVAMFVLHLGSATFLLTEPVISAMTTGAATHVVTSQVKYLLGMKMPYISGPLGFFYIYAYIFENIKSIQLEALLLSMLSIAILILVKELNEKYKRKIKVVLPIDLVLIIATSVACYSADMEHNYGLDIVGHIPEGIPPPRSPPMDILPEVITEAFGVALVGYVASLALAQASAKKFNYFVDDNQEFLAHGLSNVIPSFFFCIPSAAAMGRTALLYSTGAKTQVACLISCILVLVVIYILGPMLYCLPMCVLASIIVVGLKGMLMQFRDLKKYWNVDKIDWGIWVSTYIFTICFAANVGLLYGVLCTILIVVFRFPRATTLSLKHMKDMEYRFKTEADSESSRQLKIVSVNNPLICLNAKKFHNDILKIIQKESTCMLQLSGDVNKCEPNTLLSPLSNGNCCGESSLQQNSSERHTIILDCSGLTFFDFTGISMLIQIYMDSKKRNVDVLLANCKASLIKALKHSRRLESDSVVFFESVSSGVDAIQVKRNFCKVNEHTEV